MRNRGFSLIELLVAIAVIVLAWAVTLSKLRQHDRTMVVLPQSAVEAPAAIIDPVAAARQRNDYEKEATTRLATCETKLAKMVEGCTSVTHDLALPVTVQPGSPAFTVPLPHPATTVVAIRFRGWGTVTVNGTPVELVSVGSSNLDSLVVTEVAEADHITIGTLDLGAPTVKATISQVQVWMR